MNKLYYGDNLDILREHIPDESVDLIYLDPPFNSNRSYNVLFKEANGTAAGSQIAAFDDSWHWGAASEDTLREIVTTASPHVVEMIQAIVGFVGRNDVTAYLVMMTIRLIELHRVLKPTGSIYLHCDPTASHYLKVVMDTIFGARNFQNEIIWHRTQSSGSSKAIAKRFPSNADTILFYAKGPDYTFNHIFQDYSEKYKVRFRKKDERGYYYLDNLKTYSEERLRALIKDNRVEYTKSGKPRIKNYLHEGKGVITDNVWTDIEVLNSQSNERLGYPTQKPLALLERIIQASSNPGDLVLDPFCGCGTTVAAAQKLGRQWVGIDVTHLSIALMRQRLDDMFGDTAEYEVIGQPADLASAEALARQDRHQFEWWALSLIKARPAQDKKKGADQGIDGVLFFIDEARKKAKKVVIQVKSGHVQSSYIRDLGHVVAREQAAMGFLITLERPTAPMLTEALSTGYYHSPGWNRDYPKIQIRTIEQLLNGEWFEYPQANVTLAQAERVEDESEGEQGKLF